MVRSFYRVRGDDDKSKLPMVGLDDDHPAGPSVTRGDDEPTRYDVISAGSCILEHHAKFHL